MTIQTLSHSQRIDWLRLTRTSGVGPVTFAELLNRYHSADAALDALPGLAKRGGRSKPFKLISSDEAYQELERLDALGARLLCACEPDFPALLRTLEPPPPVISTLGPLSVEAQPCCAIVGSRNASAVGIKFAGQLAYDLGQRSISTVSGLARGIDGAAHAASLQTGTIGIIACGLGRVYPPEHAELQHAIAEHGLLVSESPPDYTAKASDFPRRNRLIAGLSLGVVVIEAAERSGSLITARLAAEQGREVMAVPGSPLDPRAKGTNKLLRDGAALIETADDVIAVLNEISPTRLHEDDVFGYESEPVDFDWLDKEVTKVRETVFALLSPVPVSKNDIVRQTQLPANIVLASLVELELAGRCVIAPGGMVYSEDPGG